MEVTELIKYENARRALSEAVMFDEVMSIMNVAEQAALYAKQANDNDLVEKATEIRVRAQRKAGEMLTKAKESGDLDSGMGGDRKSRSAHSTVKLSEIGITKDQSSRYQSLASMSEAHFETAVATAKDTAGEVTTAFMLREAKRVKPAGKPKTGPKANAIRQEIKAANERGVSMLCSYARLLLGAIRASEGFTEEEGDLLNQIASAIDLSRSVLHED